MEFKGISECTASTQNISNDNGNSETSALPKKVVHSFYFPKMNSFFVDPALKERLKLAKKSLKKVKDETSRLSIDLECLKKSVESTEYEMKEKTICMSWEARWAINRIESLKELLEKYWPESVNEDPDKVPDPKIEAIRYKERTEELIAQFHKTNKIAEEKRIIRELDQLKRSKEQLDHDVEEAEAKIPKPVCRGDYWSYGFKYDIFREIRVQLEKIPSLEKTYDLKRQELEKAESRVLEHQVQVQKQADVYNKYCKLLKRAKELGRKKDLVALEELSQKEVEG